MRALSLLVVFVVARVCVLAGRSGPLSPWSPVAYLWQDWLVVLTVAVLDARVGRAWFGWAVYGTVALYTAVNVPVARVLATPLTWPLLRAARGPLADSILTYATWANACLVLLVLATAATVPLLVGRLRPRPLAVVGAALLPPLIVLGPYAVTRIETRGLHRNALAALVTTALPRVTGADLATDRRVGPVCEVGPAEDLGRYRGAAAGWNVVLVGLESTAACYLRPYGAAEDPMPRLSRLAGRALLFENAYAVYPESIKGLFSVLCSTDPAMDTAPELYERIRPPALAEELAAAGYRTALFHSGRFGYLGMEAIVRNRGFEALEDAGVIGGDAQSSFGLDDERQAVRRVLAWLDDVARGERFFITYLPIAGHHPYASPGPYPFPTAEAIGRYRNALHHADVALGELWQGLEERGLADRTLVVVYGDHGEAFGQHEGNIAHTLFIYEENVHVPLLVIAPGLFRPTERVRRTASLIDVAPTVLDLLGLPPPPEYQGTTLLVGPARPALFFTDYSLSWLGVREGRWKFIHEVESGRSSLYDLAADPNEQADVGVREPGCVEAYRQHVLRWARGQRYRVLSPSPQK